MIVILNAGAGPASNAADAVRSKLADAFDVAGVSADVIEVHDSDRLLAGILKALVAATDTVVAAAGDGTVSSVAGQLARKTACLFVGNNEYRMSGFRIGGRPGLNSGTLGLYLTHQTGRFGLVRTAARALFGRLNQAKDFDALSVEEATINWPHKRLLVATDGEVSYMEPPLHYRSRPRALRTIVPG